MRFSPDATRNEALIAISNFGYEISQIAPALSGTNLIIVWSNCGADSFSGIDTMAQFPTATSPPPTALIRFWQQASLMTHRQKHSWRRTRTRQFCPGS
jgi:hypothetical protein